MTNDSATIDRQVPAYSHTQTGPLCLILYGSALLCFIIAAVDGSAPGALIGIAVGLVLVLTGSAFHFLAVEDRGSHLSIRFGYLPLFRRSLRYSDIASVETGRTWIGDGWGIHYTLNGGWLWNLWGRDCVVVHLKRGLLRIGSDDAAHLAEFLKSRIVTELMG